MTANGWLQMGLYIVVLLLLAKPLGAYMARVYEGEPVFLDRLVRPLERLTYRLLRVAPEEEMGWKAYAGRRPPPSPARPTSAIRRPTRRARTTRHRGTSTT